MAWLFREEVKMMGSKRRYTTIDEEDWCSG
jgi:hypothetical protein